MPIDFLFSNTFFLALVLSFGATAFWLLFYFYYSPRYTTPRGTLVLLFLLGVGAALAARLIEKAIFDFLPPSIIQVLGVEEFQVKNILDLLLLVFFMFAIVAPVEELMKFSVLRAVMRVRSKEVNQIVDGLKFGIVVGLGFVTVENFIYFSNVISLGNTFVTLQTIFLRFFTATLAHSLYSGMMGYFLGLASFYRLYAKRFTIRGIAAAIILHGLYNTLLFSAFSFYSIFIIIILLPLLIKWYSDRRYLERKIEKGETELILPPFWSDRPEFESILAKNNVSYAVIKKLRLCPFCLRRDAAGDNGLCGYCGRKMTR